MKIENLSFSYEDKSVFKNFSCEISSPVTCLTAPSGFGKTTLLRLIAGLENPNTGSISPLPQKPAFMFQEDRLFPWLTALQNVETVMPKGSENKAKELLIKVGLSENFNSYPDELSGGMKRRVALARTLAYEADLLLLDEPFKGLDIPLAQKMCSLIKNCGVQTIVATHSPEEISLLGGFVLDLDKTNRL